MQQTNSMLQGPSWEANLVKKSQNFRQENYMAFLFNILQLPPYFVLLLTKKSYIIEICTIFGFYATKNDSSTPVFQENLSVPIIL
jgi:hypothetical protein